MEKLMGSMRLDTGDSWKLILSSNGREYPVLPGSSADKFLDQKYPQGTAPMQTWTLRFEVFDGHGVDYVVEIA